MIDIKYVKDRLPKRLSFQNKGNFGHILIIGGSVGMSGSVCMSAMGALRSGAGLVTVAVPRDILPVVAVKTTESMTLPLSSADGVFALGAAKELSSFLPKANAAAFGMGARTGGGTTRLAERLLSAFDGTLVIDADGLNTLAQNPELLERERKCSVILTPHPGEMARLSGASVADVQGARETCAKEFAQKTDTVVVLKGEKTVISDGKTVLVNPTGNVGMATGGSGDVLSGIIASLAGQGLTPLESAACGAYLHGLAGDIAVKDKTAFGLIAGDLIEYLPRAFHAVLNG